jgi:hypothetical protein
MSNSSIKIGNPVMLARLLLVILAWPLAGLAAAQTDARLPPHGRLPASVDLMPAFERLGVTARAQGNRDTCSLFAVAGVAEFEVGRDSHGRPPRLSEEFLIWAADKAAGMTGDQAMFYKAVHGLNALGICPEELMPYRSAGEAARRPSPAALAAAKEESQRWLAHWIKRWDVKCPLSPPQMSAIRRALAARHPVACGLRWPKQLAGHQLLEVPPPAKVFDGHSILLTGYADDARRPGGGVFLFRNSDGPKWGKDGYGVMSFAYAERYANDALWLEREPRRAEVPVVRYEAEGMPVLASQHCSARPQDMKPWGGPMWSGGRQLFCGAQQGGFVELGFSVPQAGRYRVRVLASAGPDFGIVREALDGQPWGAASDLYSGRVCPAGSLELGTLDLPAGPHRLRVKAVGKNAVSHGFAFGLDAVDLLSPLR